MNRIWNLKDCYSELFFLPTDFKEMQKNILKDTRSKLIFYLLISKNSIRIFLKTVFQSLFFTYWFQKSATEYFITTIKNQNGDMGHVGSFNSGHIGE